MNAKIIGLRGLEGRFRRLFHESGLFFHRRWLEMNSARAIMRYWRKRRKADLIWDGFEGYELNL